jgi:pimeloyl-ACP methyl ester carboxylesterase
MIELIDIPLPHGITLSCRVSGPKGAPVIIFLHGFPEAAFVWDETLAHFSSRYRCIAPNLRGYERSSAPTEVAAYRPKHLVGDILALAATQGTGPIEALVAHDWGGAVAWNLAAQHPDALRRLVIFNSPHPATFLRELQTNPEQQAASAYMNEMQEPDAEARLSANGFEHLFGVLTAMGNTHPTTWLTEELKDTYRAIWSQGLSGPVNYYRASPLRPPLSPTDPVMALQFPIEFVKVRVPTRVVWGEDDRALRPSLLNGLEAYVPQLTVVRIPGATHWLIHEQPGLAAREIEAALKDGR